MHGHGRNGRLPPPPVCSRSNRRPACGQPAAGHPSSFLSRTTMMASHSLAPPPRSLLLPHSPCPLTLHTHPYLYPLSRGPSLSPGRVVASSGEGPGRRARQSRLLLCACVWRQNLSRARPPGPPGPARRDGIFKGPHTRLPWIPEHRKRGKNKRRRTGSRINSLHSLGKKLHRADTPWSWPGFDKGYVTSSATPTSSSVLEDVGSRWTQDRDDRRDGRHSATSFRKSCRAMPSDALASLVAGSDTSNTAEHR